MDSKKKNVNAKFIMYITITILIMAFIFFQSSLPADTSQEESDIIVRFLSRFTDRDAEMLSFIVRKMAHFSEYTALGLFISLTVKEHFQKGHFYIRHFIIPLIFISLVYTITLLIILIIHLIIIFYFSQNLLNFIIFILGFA